MCLEQESGKGSRENSGREKEQEINKGQKGKACIHVKYFVHHEGAGELYNDFKQLDISRILQNTKQPP